jgi:EAL domain-containing protein (putative c-di-GMP-specific phosphodiesterase class I)
MQEQVRNNMELEHDLRLALEQNQLELYYQPIIDVESGQVASAEALLRWEHPVHGFVPPTVFVALAEESGLIGSLGLWVLREACRQFAEWREEELLEYISVNVSSRQRGLGLTTDLVEQALSDNGLDGSCLALEITESLFLEQSEDVIAWLNSLKKLGIRLSIDDFGTGYSSLSYLKRFPIDIIKIDRSFIGDITDEVGGDSLVDAILAMARSLGLNTVAEGVTTKEQIKFLEERGCGFFQGFYFSQPIPADKFREWLRASQPMTTSGQHWTAPKV